jgi:hypothetical protein
MLAHLTQTIPARAEKRQWQRWAIMSVGCLVCSLNLDVTSLKVGETGDRRLTGLSALERSSGRDREG